MMTRWQQFLDSLNSDGGHIFLLLALAVAMTVMHGQSVEKFQGEVVGGLLVALRGGVRPSV